MRQKHTCTHVQTLQQLFVRHAHVCAGWFLLIPAQGTANVTKCTGFAHFGGNCFVLWLLCCTCCGTLRMGVCLHVCAHAHCLPLTTPPSASTAAPPPPPHTIVDIDACRTQYGGCAVCCEGLPCRKGGGRGPTGVSDTMQARASEFLEHHASPLPLSQERHHKHTRHHKSHSRGAGRGAARLLGAGDTARELTRVHRLPSRDHRRSPRELRCPAINTFCFNNALLH